MYNLALDKENSALSNVKSATDYANAERQYYDALQRGDIETAFNIAQSLKTMQQSELTTGLNAETSALSPAYNTYSSLVELDDKNYQAALANYSIALENANRTKNWELGLSKMMSIADPGGSYLGNYNKPQQGDTAKSMSSLPQLMQLYSAWR
jgi:hypothetical protein